MLPPRNQCPEGLCLDNLGSTCQNTTTYGWRTYFHKFATKKNMFISWHSNQKKKSSSACYSSLSCHLRCKNTKILEQLPRILTYQLVQDFSYEQYHRWKQAIGSLQTFSNSMPSNPWNAVIPQPLMWRWFIRYWMNLIIFHQFGYRWNKRTHMLQYPFGWGRHKILEPKRLTIHLLSHLTVTGVACYSTYHWVVWQSSYSTDHENSQRVKGDSNYCRFFTTRSWYWRGTK